MNLELKGMMDTLVGIFVGVLLGLLSGANIALYFCNH